MREIKLSGRSPHVKSHLQGYRVYEKGEHFPLPSVEIKVMMRNLKVILWETSPEDFYMPGLIGKS